MSTRSSVYTLLILAPVAWIGLFIFTRYVPPSSSLAFLAFFVILGVALTSTFAVFGYLIGRRVLAPPRYRVNLRATLRQGALLSLVVMLNLMLRALDSWNIIMALVILIAAIIVEALCLARKW